MVDLDTESTKADALDVLREAAGQSYLLTEEAAKILHPFRTDVEPAFVVNHTMFDAEDVADDPSEDHGALALSGALESKQRSAREARGITSVQPHEMLVTFSDVSAIIVEALGGEPSQHVAGGHGFTADGRHDSNVETLAERIES